MTLCFDPVILILDKYAGVNKNMLQNVSLHYSYYS